MSKPGVPVSSLNGEPHLRSKAKVSHSRPSPQPRPGRARKKGSSEGCSPAKQTREAAPATFREASTPGAREHVLAEGSASPFAKARIVGTTSAKMSYLISQISKHHRSEKILVFYHGDNIAYYMAQVLELMHIRHEIYAKSLSADKQSEYVVRFNQEPEDRVLLMDVNQAALGLNLCSASRIYFVNPVCRPNVEAQAIKRAHRIGQTREVFVETLVLRDTIEERMLERSNGMTRSEHLDAKVLEDDGRIREIIQSARSIDLDDRERTPMGQMAPLAAPQQLWGRPGWSNMSSLTETSGKRKRPDSPEQASSLEDEASPAQKRAHSQILVRRFSLPLFDGNVRTAQEDSDDKPLAEHWWRDEQPALLHLA